MKRTFLHVDHSDELIDSVDLINLLSGVVGGGQKSLPCDPGSELPLGREQEKQGRGQQMVWGKSSDNHDI